MLIMFNKKFLAFLIVSIFLISTISAIGEKKIYHEETDTAEIVDNWDLPIISSTVSNITLLKKNVNGLVWNNDVAYVQAGEDKLFAELYFNNFKDYNDALKGINFYYKKYNM